MIDLTSMTDDDLDSLRIGVLNEQEKRQAILNAPSQIAQLTAKYLEAIGGDQVMSDQLTAIYQKAISVESVEQTQVKDVSETVSTVRSSGSPS